MLDYHCSQSSSDTVKEWIAQSEAEVSLIKEGNLDHVQDQWTIQPKIKINKFNHWLLWGKKQHKK